MSTPAATTPLPASAAYPNSVQDELTVELQTGAPTTLTLYHLTGRVVHRVGATTATRTTLTLPAGTCALRTTDGQRVF